MKFWAKMHARIIIQINNSILSNLTALTKFILARQFTWKYITLRPKYANDYFMRNDDPLCSAIHGPNLIFRIIPSHIFHIVQYFNNSGELMICATIHDFDNECVIK